MEAIKENLTVEIRASTNSSIDYYKLTESSKENF